MTDVADHPAGDSADAPPSDRTIDRRAFLSRLAAATAAASAGALAWRPTPAAARPLRPPPLDPRAWAAEVRPEALADPTELTIAEAATLFRRRQLHPVELVDAYLDRIAAFDDTYQAWNTVLADAARAAAAATDVRGARSPLLGIPLAIKDNYYTAGVPTTANSFVYADFVPAFDATTVANLEAAGAIVLGKTQMGPLATTRATTPTGEITTVNAWAPTDPGVNPGGSSTGSATAVAGRMATSSIGTQTGGSITAPSNAQGLTGLKPTMGRASLYGIIPLTSTRDHPGPLARDALDAAIMLQTMAGADPADPRTQGLPPLPNLVAAATPVRRGGRVGLRWPTRVGVIPGYTSGSSATAQARRAFLDTLADLGADVVEVTLPEDWNTLTGSRFNNVRLPERSEPFLEHLKDDVRLFGVSLNSWIQGLFLSGDEYLKGQRAKLLLLRRVLDDLFAQCDVVVQTSPVPFDIIGLPELALPIGFGTSRGFEVPLGAILGGLPYAEDRLLSLAAAYQAVTDWHTRRPADPAVGAAAAPAQARALGRAAPAPRGRLTAAEVVELTQ